MVMKVEDLLSREQIVKSTRNGLLKSFSLAPSRARSWLPIISLAASIGVLLVAAATVGARTQAAWATNLFWLGLLVMYLPVAWRVSQAQVPLGERIGLLVALTLGLYAVKLFYSPTSFKSFDELLHVRSAADLISTGVLFNSNPLLPISPLFPGLEMVVNALNQLGGFDIFTAGVIVIGVAKFVLVTSIFLVYRYVANSNQIAAIATLIYIANPSFVFFDSMFAYESLALSLLALALLILMRWLYTDNRHPRWLLLLAGMIMTAVGITHHMTSYAMLAFLVLWSAIDAVIRYVMKSHRRHIGGYPAIIAVLAILIWYLYVGDFVIFTYYGHDFFQSISQLARILLFQSNTRALFSSQTAATAAAAGERFLSYGAVGLIMIFMPLGVLRIWRKHRRNPEFVTFAVGALAYPVSQAFRFVSLDFDIAGRSSAFLFLPLGFVMAIGLIEVVLPRIPAQWRQALLTLVLTVTFLGGVAVGWKPQPPGPYRATDSTRAIDPQSLSAAEWANDAWGADHRLATDRINGLLMVAYGGQDQITMSQDWVPVPLIFQRRIIDPSVIQVIERGEIEYLVVDTRLSTTLPLVGFYFEQSEPGAHHYTDPIDPAALAKFDGVEGVNLIYDDGSIRIYDVRAFDEVP